MSDFKTVYSNDKAKADFYLFLKNIFHLYPEDKFHHLIQASCDQFDSDEAIYHHLQQELVHIKPFLSELTLALPALRHQKAEMSHETLELLDRGRNFDGYVEIGTTGRYISEIRHHLLLTGPIYLINDVEPTFSPPDILERSQIPKLGTYVPLDGYVPIAPSIADQSIDLLTCFIGLHHIPAERLEPFVESIARVLRPGAVFVLRDHDVATPDMDTFVSLVHTVFNAGLEVSWEVDQADTRRFRPICAWSDLVCSKGFTDSGRRLLQEGDPTLNTLMAFTRV